MVESYLLEQINGLYPRRIESALKHDINSGSRIIVLLGSRQVGKTSLMYRLMEHLLTTEHIAPAQMEYLDLEFPHILSQVNGMFGQDFLDFLSARGMDSSKQCFVFIDEIHYLDEPSSFLKTLHDHFPRITLIVSGSSSLQIQKKFKDSLTGRKSIVHVNPLDFHEFLVFKRSSLAERKSEFSIQTILKNGKLPDLSELRFLQDDFQKLYDEFTIFGGYPGVVFLNTYERKTRLIEEIYQSYVMKDIKDVASIENLNAFNNMISLLSHQVGSLINVSELCVSLGISRPTVEHYLFLLEETFILTALQPFFTNKRKEIVKSSKVYFNDTGLRNVAARNMDPLEQRVDSGMLFENSVFSQLKKSLQPLQSLRYYRTKGKAEVDFVLQEKYVVPLEVKSGILKEPKIPRSLRGFINSYGPEYACLVNRNLWAEQQLNSTTLFFLPAWAV
ncbi:MAG: AAA family ATPase [Candidatus Aegiribacteria sp.]|nr:AAA family ATPase [Candidatus Aegiribacteria sp.]